jgi:hypothetical protein
MARKPAFQRVRGWAVNTSDLSRAAADFEKLAAGAMEENFTAGHRAAADHVMEAAKTRASAFGRQTVKAANDPRVFSAQVAKTGATLRLRGSRAMGEVGPHDPARWVFAAEFGMSANRKRLVRDRISTIEKRQGKVTRKRGRPKFGDGEHSFGNLHVVRGWNQLGTAHPWRGSPKANVFEGGPGYFFWPAIRESKPKLAEIYGQGVVNSFRDQFN